MSHECEFCGKRFEDLEALGKHVRLKHGDRVKLAILEHPVRPKGKAKPP